MGQRIGCRDGDMAFDLVIDIENTPGALAQVAAAISDAGVNIAAATCVGTGERAEMHILVPHAEAARHSLAISHLAVSREREVVVVDVEDRPGVLADLTRKIAKAGVDLDLVYVATRNRVVFGSVDLTGLRAALDSAN
ncbi:MAG TPA: ACT domain-containing protein [Solirubrobacteraceae bacterium]|nr:ACT domain-containing protein [Solirubrobacteraceae bacterium]